MQEAAVDGQHLSGDVARRGQAQESDGRSDFLGLANLQATRDEARQVLDGKAAAQYGALFTELQQAVPDQQLSLTSKVVRAGVTELSGDEARLLVFLDQASVRSASHGSGSTAGAQLSITAKREAGRWRIVSMSSE